MYQGAARAEAPQACYEMLGGVGAGTEQVGVANTDLSGIAEGADFGLTRDPIGSGAGQTISVAMVLGGVRYAVQISGLGLADGSGNVTVQGQIISSAMQGNDLSSGILGGMDGDRAPGDFNPSTEVLDQNLPLLANVKLTPGCEGTLLMTESDALTLRCGNYYFRSIQSLRGFTTVKLNLIADGVGIFVAGPIDLPADGDGINFQPPACNPHPSTAIAGLASAVTDGLVNPGEVRTAEALPGIRDIFAPVGPVRSVMNEMFAGPVIEFQSFPMGGTVSPLEPWTSQQTGSVPEPAAGIMLLSIAMLGGRRHSRRPARCHPARLAA
jgi:hypothetical protein